MNYKENLIKIRDEVVSFYDNLDVKSADEIDKVEFIRDKISNGYTAKYAIMNVYDFCMIEYESSSDLDKPYIKETIMSLLLTYLVLVMKNYHVFGGCSVGFDGYFSIIYKMFNSTLFRDYDFYEVLFSNQSLTNIIYKLSKSSYDLDEIINYCKDRYCVLLDEMVESPIPQIRKEIKTGLYRKSR